MTNHTLRPGQIIDRSGIYRESVTGEKTTLVEGKRVPPTSEPGGKWREIVDTHPRKPSGPNHKKR